MKDKNKVKFPLIGISATLLKVETGGFAGLEQAAVSRSYIRAIQLAGGVPFLLPIVEEEEFIDQQIQMIDGLLLSGGYDICPLQYKEEPKQGLETLCPERDVYEKHLIHRACQLKKPILGICRGLQLLNVALGGSLYQDINLAFPSALQHNSKAQPQEATHTVNLVQGKKLQQIMGEDTLLTNSFHHQGIHRLASSLVMNAQAKDGIIEGIEGIEDFFILGVQWHPELMVIKYPHMLKIFQAFVEAAGNRKNL